MCVKVKINKTKIIFIENEVFTKLSIDTEARAIAYAKDKYPDALKYEFFEN
jgi:hypothetical protein